MTIRDRDPSPRRPERRRTQRAPVSGRLQASRLPDDQPITVINLGMGGFRIRTTYGFTVSHYHEFRFELADGTKLDIGAIAVYCTPRVTLDGTVIYLTGFELADDAHRNNRSLVEEILHDLAFRLSIKAG